MVTRGIVAAFAALMLAPGAAQAAQVYVTYKPDGPWQQVAFVAGPGESPDLKMQVLDNGGTVIFEDHANPLSTAIPPDDESTDYIECTPITPHKARCEGVMPGFGFPFMTVQMGPSPFSSRQSPGGLSSRIRDLRGDPGTNVLLLETGVLSDDIKLRHQHQVWMTDLGGPNRIVLGGMSAQLSSVTLGPGASTVDVRNGVKDRVDCLKGLASFAAPPGIGTANQLDTVVADPNDEIRDCD